MDSAKIRLSPEEMALVKNADWILTKNGILEKVKVMLASLQVQQEEWLKSTAKTLPDEVMASTAKISRGEKYEGLPYLVLDYPRVFARQDVFTVRTFLWWGNFFSTTLQLGGIYKKQFEDIIVGAYEKLCGLGYNIGIHEDPWQHHFRIDNYNNVHAYTAAQFGEYVREAGYIKLSKRTSLDEWDVAANQLECSFRELMELLK